MDDLISRQTAIKAFKKELTVGESKGKYVTICSAIGYGGAKRILESLPSAQPEYEPVTAEDFAKTMSEYTIYRYAMWYSEALALMKEQGFVICKKTM